MVSAPLLPLFLLAQSGLPRSAKSFPSPASCSAQNSLPNKPAPPSSSRRRLPPYSRPLLPPQTKPTHNISWIFGARPKVFFLHPLPCLPLLISSSAFFSCAYFLWAHSRKTCPHLLASNLVFMILMETGGVRTWSFQLW